MATHLKSEMRITACKKAGKRYSEVCTAPDGRTFLSESSRMSKDSGSDGNYRIASQVSLISELAALAAAEARSTEQLRIRNSNEMFVN